MGSKKRIQGDYYIESIDPSGQIFIDTDKLTVDGEVIVTGTLVTVDSTNLAVSDNTILLNSGETGSGVTLNTAGIEIDRGLSTNVGLRYNDTVNYWEATDDGFTWYPINASIVISTFELVDDSTPQLGGNLDVNGYTITSASNGDIVIEANGTGLVMINQELSLEEQVSDPAVESGYNKIYAKTPESGNSGVFVVNSTTEDELISYRKAIALNLIL